MFTHIKFIPYELTLKIFSYLDVQDLCMMFLVDKRWNKLIDNKQLIWEKKVEENFPHLKINHGWKHAFFQAKMKEYPHLLNAENAIKLDIFEWIKERNLSKLKALGKQFKLVMLATTDKNDMTLLDWANIKNYQPILDYIYQVAQQYYSNSNVTHDFSGRTLLFWAVSTNQKEAVEQLILQGFDLNSSQIHSFNECIFTQTGCLPLYAGGITPLHIAAAYDRIDIIKLLLSHGATIDGVAYQVYAPIHLAVEYGNDNTLKFLLAQGANINISSSVGATALHFAAKNGDSKLISILLEKGANIDACAKNPILFAYFEMTPLTVAAKYGQIDAVKLLLANGANIDGISCITSPLYFAIQGDHDKIVKLLLDKGARPQISFNKEETMVTLATRFNSKKVVKLLLDLKKDEHILFAMFLLTMRDAMHPVPANNTSQVNLAIKHLTSDIKHMLFGQYSNHKKRLGDDNFDDYSNVKKYKR